MIFILHHTEKWLPIISKLKKIWDKLKPLTQSHTLFTENMATTGDKEMVPVLSETLVAMKPIHSGAEKEYEECGA